MNRVVLTIVSVIILAAAVSAQKIAKPTLTPVDATESQRVLIEEGIRLHDKQDYDSAIKKYELVLAANPDCTLAMYELAMTLYTKGNTEKAVVMAVRGSKYRASELPLFYMTIANALDDVGKAKEAIEIYRDALAILKSEKGLGVHLSNIEYNLGVTYVKQKQYKEARTELKKAVEYNNSYASPHYLLAEVFVGSHYKVPAFLSAARLVSLEYNTPRTDRAVQIIRSVLKAAEKDEKTGNINIFVDMNAPADEGNFGGIELFLGTLMVVKDDKAKAKTEEEKFADAIDTLIALIAEDKKLKDTFVGQNYIPFIVEMRLKGHTTAFAHIILYKSGNAGALKWLTQNTPKMTAFLQWAKDYQLPSK
ncbi:MAG: tetratricopeptide repeat protein [Acidobacteriota bacterium]